MSISHILGNRPTLNLSGIKDPIVQENFQALARYFLDNTAFVGFKFFTFTFVKTGTFLVPHNLGYQPLDLAQTSLIGSGTLTWQYSQFDRNNLSVIVGGTVTTANPTIVRAYVGTHILGGQT